MNSSVIDKNKVNIKGPVSSGFKEILTDEAIDFFNEIHKKFENRRLELLELRKKNQLKINGGIFPDFLKDTENIRESEWRIAPIPEDLLDRRVEITGPVDRKMIINALNSNVKVFMADFEDSTSPTWNNIIDGQINLRDAVRRTITFTNPKTQKFYKLNKKTATLMVRPRGWHLVEKNVMINDKPVSASLLDFSLYFYHNAKYLLKNGSGPYFYLPKLESHIEAKLWNDVFNFAQIKLGVPLGSIRATVLIETITAAFEMDEILYELKDHSAGLNCGRWDYIFSFIKKFRKHKKFTLPDRSEVTMERHFLKSYVELLIYTCHKRGAHAMGGMAAQIPIKNNEDANLIAMNKVKEDKKREADSGHDGTWIAHPGLGQIALDAFGVMQNKNQIDRVLNNPDIVQADLLKVPDGDITYAGVRENIKVGIQYVEAWLRGNGCVPLYNLMEDAATAEISRAQLWQWLHNNVIIEGNAFCENQFNDFVVDECSKIRQEIGESRYKNGKFDLAVKLFSEMIKKNDFDEFLTLPAYKFI
ncbi:MAG: malate synthase A [Pelagibacteraceae bacterium TMED237]|nr:malate synthase A [Candidatus Neomarinimicrobiota bacterium]OUW96754.1 MAG: malate synthase A [Pelagibacteraceae bacterium TMED237]|tara:strand:- start:5914 stop:7506 length:1593 start_codon:yes stop_codon:yes gene_type:complete